MTIDDYVLSHIDAEPEYLSKIYRHTQVNVFNPRMCSGHLQGRLLSMLCGMIQPKNILELGTFTGYSALCLAEHLPIGGQLHTIENDDELEDYIRQNIKFSPFEDKIKLHIGNALEVLESIDIQFDLVFIDADKREYVAYFENVFPKLRMGGYIIADNTLWDGKVTENNHPNDRQTIGIKNFNDFIQKDTRIQKVILPIRDGLTIIRKIAD